MKSKVIKVDVCDKDKGSGSYPVKVTLDNGVSGLVWVDAKTKGVAKKFAWKELLMKEVSYGYKAYTHGRIGYSIVIYRDNAEDTLLGTGQEALKASYENCLDLLKESYEEALAEEQDV